MDQLFGRYRILSQLGRGAMGVVYLGEDPLLSRQVAIKTVDLNAEAAGDKEFLRERLVRDARAAAMLSHPHIVSIYDIFEENGKAYLVMEYIAGETLAARLNANPAPDSETMLRILREIAEGLDYTHGRGVVHRDIKPANVMIDASGAAKIMDFGIARITDARTTTPTGMVLGTVEYMAPEQIKGEALDGRADQFALAAIAYQMMTGSTLFGPQTFATLAYKIVAEMPPPARSRNPGLPVALDAVLEKALAKSPADRFASCREFVQSLDTAFHGAPQAAATAAVAASVAAAPTVSSGISEPTRSTRQFDAPPIAPATKTISMVWVAAILIPLAAGAALMVWKPWSSPVTPVTTPSQPPAATVATPPAGTATPPASTTQAAVETPPVTKATAHPIPVSTSTPPKGQPEREALKQPPAEKSSPSAADLANGTELESKPESAADEKGVPGPAMEMYLKGDALMKAGQFAAAVDTLNKAIALRPNLARAYLARGIAYRRLDNCQAAIKDLSEVLRLRPKDAPAFTQRGLCYAHMNQEDAALADYQQSLSIHPDMPVPLNGRGVIFLRRKAYNKAIADFTEAIRVAPDFALAYQNRARARAATGNEAGSIADAKKAKELNGK
jgi:serine/threonine protein kinase/Flp pilus assembly protein TadD